MATVSFADLKKRQRSTTKDELKAKLSKETKSNDKDNRFWKPTMIKSTKGGDVVGTCSDVIRFLPESYADLKLVEQDNSKERYLGEIFHRIHHAFQGPNGWYFEESRSMLIGDDGKTEKCPVAERTVPMWKEAKETGNKARKEKIKNYMPKDQYIANILVIKDGSNPENNGKVFLFNLTKAMRDKLYACIDSEFDDEPTFNPFDLDEGRAFELRLEYKNKLIGEKTFPVADYAKAKFQSTPSPLAATEEEIDSIMEQAHSFFSYLSAVKTEAELNAQLDKVFSYKSDKVEYKEKEAAEEFESVEPSASAVGDQAINEYAHLLND